MKKLRPSVRSLIRRLMLFATGMLVVGFIVLLLPEKLQSTSPQGDIVVQAITPSVLTKLITLSNNDDIEYGIYRNNKYYKVDTDSAGEWWNGETRLNKIEWSSDSRRFFVYYERIDVAATSTDSGSLVREFEIIEKPPYARRVHPKDD